MLRKLVVIVWIGLVLASSSNTWAKGKANACEKIIPNDLKELTQHTYPGYQVVTLPMLTDVGQKIYSKDRKGGCPGVAKVRFFAKNKIDYALVLSKSMGKTHLSNLILAKRDSASSWALIAVETDIQDAPPAVLVLRPGKYTGDDADGRPRTLESPNEVLFLVGYESWSIVYVSTENGIEKVWLSD